MAGKLARTIETRLRSIVEPSVEQMQEAIKKDIRTLEEEILENMPGSEEMERRGAQDNDSPAPDKKEKTTKVDAAEQPEAEGA
jgi:hypothetical protein